MTTYLVVITLDCPTMDALADAIKAIDPPQVPYATGDVRLVVNPLAQRVLTYLDESDTP